MALRTGKQRGRQRGVIQHCGEENRGGARKGTFGIAEGKTEGAPERENEEPGAASPTQFIHNSFKGHIS